LTLLTRSLANLALVLMAGLACVAPPTLRTGEQPTAVVQLSPAAVSPGTWIRVQGAGFRVGEYVEIVVTDPAGTQTRLGKLIADGQGDIEAEVAPGDQVRNGVTVITLSGTESERTAAVPINLLLSIALAGLAAFAYWQALPAMGRLLQRRDRRILERITEAVE